MNPQHLRNIRGENQYQKDEGYQRFADDLLTVINFAQFPHERADQSEHKEHIQDHTDQCKAGAGHASGFCNGNDGGQQTPRRNVVVGGTGNGQHPHWGFAEVTLLNDSGQDRKSRNTDRNTDKQCKRHEGGMSGTKLRIDLPGQNGSKKKRHNNTGMADDQGLASLFAQDAQVKLHADNKHKEDQADLAQNIERFKR